MDDKNTSIPVTDGDAEASMDDAQFETSNTQPAAPQSVMDVTPPPHDAVVTTESEPTGPPAVDAPSEAEPMPDLATEPTEVAPEPESPLQDTPPIDEPIPIADEPAAPLTGPSDQSVVNPTGAENMPAAAAVAPAKKSSKSMVIVVAILLALVLAAIAVLVYMKTKGTTNNNASNKSSTSKTATESTDKTPLTSADVVNASKNVDTSMSTLDENKDFSADSLSDKTLGLQ